MLLFRPKPYSDECPVSYLIRVAEGNGFNNFGHLLHYSGLHIENMESAVGKILSGEIKLEDSLLSLGIDFDNSKTTRLHDTFRPKIDTEFIIVKHPRACPKCLEKYGYCSYIWSFYPIIGCTEHGLLLEDTLSEHTKRLSWQRSLLNPFKNRHITFHVAESEALAFNRYISSQILKQPLTSSAPEVLKDLDLREALTLIHFIAHFQARLNNKYFKPKNMDVPTLTGRYVDVWIALENWPTSFYDVLNKYFGQEDTAVVTQHVRSLFDHLAHHKENRGIARAQQAFINYIEAHRPSMIGYLDSLGKNQLH